MDKRSPDGEVEGYMEWEEDDSIHCQLGVRTREDIVLSEDKRRFSPVSSQGSFVQVSLVAQTPRKMDHLS